MKFFKKNKISFFTSLLIAGTLITPSGNLFAKEKRFIVENGKQTVNIDFKDLEIVDFIKLVSKIMNKNVLINQNIKGKVDFISNTPIYKDNMFDILLSILHSKGYTIVDTGKFLEVIRSSNVAKFNLPIMNQTNEIYKQIVTEAIHIKNENVDIVASKIRHLISKSAKLITIKENNTILLTDFPSNIATIKNIIKIVEENSENKIEFIKLENIQVKFVFNDISRISKKMFNQKIKKEKMEIIQNKNNNSIILVGVENNLIKMKKIIKSFDVAIEEVDNKFKIIPIKNSEVKTIITVLNSIFSKKKYKDPTLKPTITSDIGNNAIVILGTKDIIKDIEGIIKELDKEKQQVYVKAKIIEISDNKIANIGIKYGIEGGTVNSSGFFSFASSLGGSSIPISSAISSFISTDSMKSGLALGASINFLKTNGAADIVSEPSILCIDNKESSIYVGETISINTGSVISTAGTTNTTTKREDVGLTLKVKPRIANDGKVTLEVSTKLEDIKDITSDAGITTTKREIKTIAIVNDGESVIVGGLIKNKSDKTVSKIPILGDIPLLGKAFRNDGTTKDKINLVIILTPYIIKKSSNLSELRKELVELDKLQRKYNVDFSKIMKDRKNNDNNSILDNNDEMDKTIID